MKHPVVVSHWTRSTWTP